MAGQPRRKLRRIEALESRAVELAAAVYDEAPSHHTAQPDAKNCVTVAWNRAVDAMAVASLELEVVGDLLRAKLGITTHLDRRQSTWREKRRVISLHQLPDPLTSATNRTSREWVRIESPIQKAIATSPATVSNPEQVNDHNDSRPTRDELERWFLENYDGDIESHLEYIQTELANLI